MEKLFDLTRLFDALRDGSVFERLPRPKKNAYPRFVELINHYESVLNSTPLIMDASEDAESFSHTSDFWDIGHYTLIWDIDKAQQYVSDNQLQVYRFTARDLMNYVFEDEIDWNYASRMNGQTHPILIAKIPFLPQMHVVIDGNHSIASAFRNNPATPLLGYALEPEVHMSFLAGDVFRVLYKIHANIHNLLHFMCGYTEQVELYPL